MGSRKLAIAAFCPDSFFILLSTPCRSINTTEVLSPALLTWFSLGILNKDRYRAMLDVYGTLDEALARLSPDVLQALGCRSDTIEKTLVRIEEFNAPQYAKELQKRGVDIVALDDPLYPARLFEIGDPPVFLSYRGDLLILEQPSIAVVGTRQMTAYGKRVTEEFVPEFVRAGLVTVSGLALGIDAVVAEETLRANGKTVAVLGHGLGSIYPPSNARLANRIVEQGGLLLSEFPLEMPPDKFTFPARNRIIAGLTLGTVVTEAPEGSGAIITAELALEYSRDVFAVPGHIFDDNYAGCHKMIMRSQAKLAQSATHVLRDLGIVASEQPESTYEPTSNEEKILYGLLSSMPQPTDDLVAKSKLNPGTVAATLTMLEISGAARNVGGGSWVRG